MERAEILEKVATLAADVLGVEPESVTERTTFDDLDADSLDRLQLVTALEDEFDIEIPDEDLETIGSVEDAIRVIESVLEA